MTLSHSFTILELDRDQQFLLQVFGVIVENWKLIFSFIYIVEELIRLIHINSIINHMIIRSFFRVSIVYVKGQRTSYNSF